ncbi:hypothetical protein [Thiosocius teredinicola]|uniref:hypothetical protein n=1 Tax=Thiosocius teredinicola TaxID=1973002 RepID=UPI000990CBEB
MTPGEPDKDLRCYAVRRVNPFEGVLQVAETHNARAYSPNGHIWQVQVIAQRPDHTWRSFSDVPPIEQFFNFGLWDAEEGLQRIPANPVMDIGAMSAAADTLTTALRDALPRLPFALIDRFECWATSYDGRPVALLATCEQADFVRDKHVTRWQATRVSDHTFTSPSLLEHGVPTSGQLGPRQHAEQLERQVRQLGQHKVWFERKTDGGGVRLIDSGQHTELAADDFPALTLLTDWKDDTARALAADYLEWQAPRLLLLQHLDDALRAQLEVQACRQAVELNALHRLLPQVIDRERVDAARVEARLRRATA